MVLNLSKRRRFICYSPIDENANELFIKVCVIRLFISQIVVRWQNLKTHLVNLQKSVCMTETENCTDEDQAMQLTTRFALIYTNMRFLMRIFTLYLILFRPKNNRTGNIFTRNIVCQHCDRSGLMEKAIFSTLTCKLLRNPFRITVVDPKFVFKIVLLYKYKSLPQEQIFTGQKLIKHQNRKYRYMG